jgi:hypothetical protein
MIFDSRCPMWLTFCIRDLHVMMMCVFELREYRRMEVGTFRMLVFLSTHVP